MSFVIDAPVPTLGRFEMNIAFDIVVSAEEAKHIADDWVFDYVSNLTRAEAPTLVVTQSATVWRVPLVFSAPQVGRVGIVDTVDVDIQTGNLLNNDVEKMTEKLISLGEMLPPYIPRQHDVPDELTSNHIPHARVVMFSPQ